MIRHLPAAILKSFAPLVFVLGSASAQTPACEALNDQTFTAARGVTGANPSGQPNRRAYRITPTSSGTLRSVRLLIDHALFQQLQARFPNAWPFFGVEIFDDTAGTPGQRLAGGFWALQPLRGHAWQGANLDHEVAFTAGTPFWLVWTEPGWTRPPVDLSGNPSVPYHVWTGSQWMILGFEYLKVRLYCGRLDGIGAADFGDPCPHASGALGTLFTNEEPRLGNSSFSLEGTGFDAQANAFLILGTSPNWSSVPLSGFPAGCALHTDWVTVIGSRTAGGLEAGHLRFDLPIPNDPAFRNAFVGAQIGAVDAASTSPAPIVFSNGLRLTLI